MDSESYGNGLACRAATGSMMRTLGLLSVLIFLDCARSDSSAKREAASSTSSVARQINVAPNDSFISEYQIVAPDSSVGSWYLNDIPNADIFFVASHARHPSGSMVIWLDTAVRATEDHGIRWTHADSVSVSGLRHLEYLARFCSNPDGSSADHVVGLVAEGDTLSHVRLAWRFNAQAFRIEPLAADSISCRLSEVIDEVD